MSRFRKYLLLSLLYAGAAVAQTSGTPVHQLNVVPDDTHTIIGQVNLYNLPNTYAISISAPTLSGNSTITLPVNSGTGTGPASCITDPLNNGVWAETLCTSVSGVTSFNTRTGAVTLTKADVTAVDQALGTGDSPTFNALTVSSCTGCGGGGGVTSFNTRTGAVTFAKADVTAVDQALGAGDSPTFAGLTSPIGATTPNAGYFSIIYPSGNIQYAVDNAYNIGGPSFSPAVIYAHAFQGGTVSGTTGTFSGSNGSSIVSITQSGGGDALVVNGGPGLFNGGLAGNSTNGSAAFNALGQSTGDAIDASNTSTGYAARFGQLGGNVRIDSVLVFGNGANAATSLANLGVFTGEATLVAGQYTAATGFSSIVSAAGTFTGGVADVLNVGTPSGGNILFADETNPSGTGSFYYVIIGTP